MKKYIAVPIVAVVAAVGAASAAGFAGGVSAGPLQVGQTNDLECATSAKVIEWGYDDGTSEAPYPSVVNVRVQLNGADCSDQAISVIPISPSGAQDGPRATGRIPAQSPGTQTVRVKFESPVNAENLKAVRISVDPGYGQSYGTVG